MKILDIYDNGGETLDRYTFVLDSKQGRWYDMLGTDETGAGFSQFDQGEYRPGGKNKHLGEPVEFVKLSDELKAHVLGRLQDGE